MTSISPQQAADALRDIAQTESRSRELRSYQRGSPIFFLWGLIWIVGYGATGYDTKLATIWLPLSLVGIAGTILFGLRAPAGLTADERRAWKVRGRKTGLTWLAMTTFCFATYAVMKPHGIVYGVFPALLVATAYCLAGIWALPRFLWLGIAVYILTLMGFFWVPAFFSYWMAMVGGITLILGGVWMRKA